jgi:hypothetical protein
MSLNPYHSSPSNTPTTSDSLHLLHSKNKYRSRHSIILFLDDEQMKYSE